ncbi:MAG: 5'/3'-nucleotidase SurE [Bacteroidetes bacterium]|nr:5'/3'-nucleotidase SurE [Bacteroidota bacterium]|tara:strand:+ start:401 stop:1180 length:780 start_codon:yes stop_codon:yes gene_type:complete
MQKPQILITNDDGIHAKGLKYLTSVMRKFGDVLVVASEESNSGQGHAITVRELLRLEKIHEEEGYREYMTDGTPVDSVKLGEQIVLGKTPDLIVSGINHGSNASVNIVYSGTMAAVIEGCITGIPSIGFSLNDYSSDADFDVCGPYIEEVVNKVLKEGLKPGVCLNVNIPAVPKEEIKGIKVCRQSDARWHEQYEHRVDPRNKDYYWLTGYFEKLENNEETDQWALDNNYVSIVPVQYDLTAHKEVENLKKWNFNGYGL